MRATLLCLVLGSALVLPARAATFEYTLAVQDGRDATFQLPIRSPYAGAVTIEASWSGPRLLYFGVEGPGHTSLTQRSGPSPQRLDLTAAANAEWTLTIKALPVHGESSGRLKVTVPDAPEIVAKREAELHPPPPPAPPPPSYLVPKPAPDLATMELAEIYGAVEAVRSAVASDKDGIGDACIWQVGFLKYATAARDRLPAAPPDAATLRYFRKMSEAIESIERLRISHDPVLAGPPPIDRNALRDWLIARSELVRPIERALDQLSELLRTHHAPDLEGELWVPRLTACLTACERFFDERVRLGGDENAENRELSQAQWGRIVAAGRVLAAFGALSKETPAP